MGAQMSFCETRVWSFSTLATHTLCQILYTFCRVRNYAIIFSTVHSLVLFTEFVYLCTYVCIHTHVHICVYLRVHMYIYVHEFVQLYQKMTVNIQVFMVWRDWFHHISSVYLHGDTVITASIWNSEC